MRNILSEARIGAEDAEGRGFLDIRYPKPIRDLVIFSEIGHLLVKSGINPVGVTSL